MYLRGFILKFTGGGNHPPLGKSCYKKKRLVRRGLIITSLSSKQQQQQQQQQHVILIKRDLSVSVKSDTSQVNPISYICKSCLPASTRKNQIKIKNIETIDVKNRIR